MTLSISATAGVDEQIMDATVLFNACVFIWL